VAILQLRTTRYKVTDQRVVVERGILSRSLEEIDLRYVDDSGFSQSPLERLQGIGTVWLISSDKSMPRLQLQGIKDPRAIREMIREQAYRMSQGQLFTRST
jgi:membrane protein YdbS with pleckstrin-like domain